MRASILALYEILSHLLPWGSIDPQFRTTGVEGLSESQYYSEVSVTHSSVMSKYIHCIDISLQ